MFYFDDFLFSDICLFWIALYISSVLIYVLSNINIETGISVGFTSEFGYCSVQLYIWLIFSTIWSSQKSKSSSGDVFFSLFWFLIMSWGKSNQSIFYYKQLCLIYFITWLLYISAICSAWVASSTFLSSLILINLKRVRQLIKRALHPWSFDIFFTNDALILSTILFSTLETSGWRPWKGQQFRWQPYGLDWLRDLRISPPKPATSWFFWNPFVQNGINYTWQGSNQWSGAKFESKL